MIISKIKVESKMMRTKLKSNLISIVSLSILVLTSCFAEQHEICVDENLNVYSKDQQKIYDLTVYIEAKPSEYNKIVVLSAKKKNSKAEIDLKVDKIEGYKSFGIPLKLKPNSKYKIVSLNTPTMSTIYFQTDSNSNVINNDCLF